MALAGRWQSVGNQPLSASGLWPKCVDFDAPGRQQSFHCGLERRFADTLCVLSAGENRRRVICAAARRHYAVLAFKLGKQCKKDIFGLGLIRYLIEGRFALI